MRSLLLAAIALSLAACAPPLRWTKPGATQQEFDLDSYNCERDAQIAYPDLFDNLARDDMSERCMEAHGWRRARS